MPRMQTTAESVIQCKHATGRLSCCWDVIVYCLVSQNNFPSESNVLASVSPAVTHQPFRAWENREGTFLIVSQAQDWYGDLWGALQQWLISYDSTVWITDSSAFRFPLHCCITDQWALPYMFRTGRQSLEIQKNWIFISNNGLSLVLHYNISSILMF